MTATQLEEALTTEALSSWERLRSSNELLSLITRHELALETIQSDELDEAF